MTDQPPTDLGTVWTTGQRRRASGQFPSRSGGGGSAGGPVQRELEEEEPQEPQGQVDPCADPATAREWNTDAAAAEGLRRMQSDANDPLLDSRERSIVIARDPVTGIVYLGNMLVGDAFAGTVGWDFTGIPDSHIIGLMHSHAATGPYPSEWDRTEVFATARSNIENSGGDPSLLRLYMVGSRADPGEPARIQIRVYNETNLDGDEDNPGPEVNPDAQPCPS